MVQAQTPLRVNDTVPVTTRLEPFRGWRYAPDIPLHDVVIPPYDVIDTGQQIRYYRRHPLNVVRLVLGLDQEGDSEQHNRYTRAAATLQRWRRAGILRQDPTPAYYVLGQTFWTCGGKRRSRLGIIGRFLLRPWGQGILPHEQTFPSARADRLALLRATHTYFNPVFALYRDPDQAVRRILKRVAQESPLAAWRDDEEVEHVLWVVRDPDRVARLQKVLANRTYYVADGHHRYETALAYQHEQRARHPHAPPGEPYDYVLLYAAAMDDPGVTILPTHRALRGLPGVTPTRVLAAARLAYTVAPVADDQALLNWVESLPPGAPDLALLFPTGPGYRLHFLPDVPAVRQGLANVPPPIADLAVYHLQRFVLGPGAGVGDAPEEQKRVLAFLPDARRLVVEVRDGRWDLVALVAPTSPAQLRAVAEAGLVAPPKATYFYPKLPSGLVMYSAAGEGNR